MPVNANDPRVKRTRQLLMQSFMELLVEKKNIYSISVQDIAARATVNRATFYAHFEDKFAFLECWMREKFQRKLKEALPDSSISNMSSLRTLILAVFDFLARTRQYMTSEDRQFEPLFEIAMQKELYQLLFEWLSKESNSSVPQEMVEATSLITSWGIFGSAVEWSRSPQNRTAEAMVQDVLVVVAAGLAPVMT
ncbi:TetR/AcrR family transcriptional regulator [Paenibacillus agricola]|uniref:TetR family transcriptional regulator n=1 Tax=Paenibacillus agricola TaxID=2716264 RepID=A0ABX0JA24_9BACL|nr:TetR/AcrR family transcriptional regulator [Paenibacillus agricola]NHN32783.1 TetR family transcriptional regulator [Paenibacillus agricola]